MAGKHILWALCTLGVPLGAQDPGNDPEPVVRITLQRETDLVGRSVLVRDLAEVSADDDELRARVGDLEIAPRPAEGFARTFRRTDVERRLVEAGLPRDAFTLRGAEATLARPKTTLLAAEKLLEVANGIARAWIAREPAADVEFEPLGRVPATAVPPGRTGVQLRGKVQPAHAERDSGMRLTIDLEILVDGEAWRTLPVHFRLRRFATVWTPVRGARAGEFLTDVELTEQRVEVPPNAPAGGYATHEELLGRVARVDLRAGRPIRNADLGEPAVVHRSDPVRLVSQRGTIRVAVKAVALEDGAAGDRIRVQNLATGHSVQAVVQGPGLVILGSTEEG